MNKRMVILLIFLLVLVGIIIIGKQREQSIQLDKMETKAANELRRVSSEAEKAKEFALEETRRIEMEAQRAKREAIEKARIAEEEALRAKEMASEAILEKASAIQAKINELVAQANALLASADYQKAIDVAQEILGLDPNNAEATAIIEQAKAKLLEVGQEQFKNFTEGEVEVPQADLQAAPEL